MLTILKTLGIILGLENTINVNIILNGFRQIPIIGKYIPEKIYSIKIFKIYATFLSVNYEIAKALFGKVGLFASVFLMAAFSTNFVENSNRCAYICFFLLASLIAICTFNAFKISLATEYAVFFLGMDAREYVIAQIFYEIVKVFIGYTIFGIPTAIFAGVQWFVALLIPFAGAGFITAALGIKMTVYAWKKSLSKKESRVSRFNVQSGMVLKFIGMFILFCAAFAGAPFFISYDLYYAGVIIMLLVAVSFVPGIMLIKRFPYELYKTAISKEREKEEIVKEISKSETRTHAKVKINETKGITDNSTGYKFLNELFFKRHLKTLLGRYIWTVLAAVGGIVLLSLYMRIELNFTNDPAKMLMRVFFLSHPAFYPLILLFTNFGTQMTYVMFTSCDSTFLLYGFYRKPDALLKMYRLRIVSLIKHNLPLTVMIAVFSVVVTFITGGEEYLFQCVLNVIIIVSIMVFYSVRYITLYYLIEPYVDKVKSIKVVIFYAFPVFSFCFWLILLIAKIPAFILAPFIVALTAGYAYLADKMVYKFAPKTFTVK